MESRGVTRARDEQWPGRRVSGWIVAGWTLVCAVLLVSGCASTGPAPVKPATAEPVPLPGQAISADGVPIAFTVTGSGEPTVVLIHCGFCDQSVWRYQVGPLSEHSRVVTLDLAGHGASGAQREVWSVWAFAEDVKAVLDVIGADRVVLVGSSLGGSVALATAEKMPGRVVGVIGVDTFQDLARPPVLPEVLRKQLEPFERDFEASCPRLVDALLPDDADPELVTELQQLMCSIPAERALAIWDGLVEWRLHEVAQGLEIPIRVINGPQVSTDVTAIRERISDFDAVVLEGVGHFPMLERPELFTERLLEMVQDLEAGS
jgi:pimeloyl-ACP methyl ester carboxylesterase